MSLIFRLLKAAFSLHYVRATLSDTSRQTTKFPRYAQVRTAGGNLAPRNDEVPFCGAPAAGDSSFLRTPWTTGERIVHPHRGNTQLPGRVGFEIESFRPGSSEVGFPHIGRTAGRNMDTSHGSKVSHDHNCLLRPAVRRRAAPVRPAVRIGRSGLSRLVVRL